MGDYSRIYLNSKGGVSLGLLKLNEHGVHWKGKESGRIVSATQKDVQAATWTQVYKGFQLKLILAGGASMKLEGFREADFNTLKEFCSNQLKVDLIPKELDTSGQSWGDLQPEKPNLIFTIDGKQSFDLPLAELASATVQNKNDINIEIRQDDTVGNKEETLQYITFQVPAGAAPADGELDEENDSPATVLANRIVATAGITDDSGKGLCLLEHVAFQLPRGRYDVELHHTYFQLSGKYSYKIKYTAVTGLFQLPRPDHASTLFLIALDPPIRQGKTAYPSIVLQFNDQDDLDLELQEEEEVLAEKYGDRITKRMTGSANDVVANIFRGMTGFKPKKPRTFRAQKGAHAIRCTNKTADGFLYPLEKSFVFVTKVVHVSFDDIQSVEFARLQLEKKATSNQTFDMVITEKDGTVVTFSSLKRDEFDNLFAFVKHKELRIKNLKAIQAQQKLQGGGTANYAEIDEDAPLPGLDDDDEAGSEDDSDFEAAASESSDGEDFEGDDDDDSSSGAGDAPKVKVKVKAPKKDKKKRKDRGDDGGDDDGDATSPKKKKKKKSRDE